MTTNHKETTMDRKIISLEELREHSLFDSAIIFIVTFIATLVFIA